MLGGEEGGKVRRTEGGKVRR